MKGLNIKKLAAVTAGAVLVASAAAPVWAGALDLAKTDVFNADGSPKVKVVVGSTAAPSDGVWAGNIAAAIANKARVYQPVSVSGEAGGDGSTATVTELSANLVVGGTVTFANAKTLVTGESSNTFDMNSASDVNEVSSLDLTDSTFQNLKNVSTTIKWAGSSYSRTFKERLGLKKLDVYFDKDNSGQVSDLELTIGTGDLNYTLDLGSGIPVYESTSVTTNFTDGSNDNVIIPFLGENYLVREVNKTSNFMRMIKSEATSAFNEGDIIPDLPGKNSLAGQTVSVRVDSIVATGPAAAAYSADVTLIDEEGNELITKTVTTGENIDDALTVGGLGAINTILYVDSIGVAASSGVGSIKVLLGTNLVDLYSAKGYPYDSSKTSNYDYVADFTYSSDGNYITKIAIKNDVDRWRDGGAPHPPLYPGVSGQALTTTGAAGAHEAFFMGTLADGQLGKDLFSIDFRGLETNEPINTIKIYNHTLEYNDASDRKHKIFLYKELSKDQKSGSSFEFDGRTLYYSSSTDDVTFDYNATTNLNGSGRTARVVDSNGAFGVVQALFAFGNGLDVNVALNGLVDINGSYFVLTDNNGSSVIGPDINGTARLRADGNVSFATAAISSATATDYLESYNIGGGVDGNNTARYDLFWNDAETTNYVAYRGNTVTLKGQDDVTFEYALFADSSATGNLYLLLDTSNNLTGRYDADINFQGTQITEDGNFVSTQPQDGNNDSRYYANTKNRPYYWPNSSKMGGGVSNNFYIGRFGVETAGDASSAAEATADYETLVYIDTNPSVGYAPTFPNTNLTQPTSDINYNVASYILNGVSDGSVQIALDTDPATTNPSVAYNDYGSRFDVSTTDRTVTIAVPDNRRRPVIIIKMAGSTSQTTGGEELTIAQGESGTTSTGTTITVSEITYNAECGGGGAAGTCVADPENFFAPVDLREQLVFLDNEAPSGRLVLVGGHLVNRLTAQVSNIADILTAPGDGTSAIQDEDTGNFVVAGYTATDTVSAARDFIESIEAIDMMG